MMGLVMLVEWAADDQPDPGDLLLLVDALHILAIRVACACEAGGVAVIDADDLVRVVQFNQQEFFWIKFKIDR